MKYIAVFILFSVSNAYSAVCDISDFTTKFQEAMAKTRKTGPLTKQGMSKVENLDESIRDAKAYLDRKEMQGDKIITESARGGYAHALKERAGKNAEVGNFTQAQKDYRAAADTYAKVSGAERVKMVNGQREGSMALFNAMDSYTNAGDIAKAADFVDPGSYAQLVVSMQDDAQQMWQGAAKLSGLPRLKQLTKVYHQFKLQAELGARAIQKGTSSGVQNVAEMAKFKAADVKKSMEELIATLPE